MQVSIPPHLAEFWAKFVAVTPNVNEARFYEAFCFGDSEELATELADLVLSGVKRATTGALWSYQNDEKLPPRPGDLSIVTNWAGLPLCVIETESADIVAFRNVTAEFAAIEGEGDGSLSFWQDGHRRYFGRECARAGREFGEDMLVVCECFKVVYQASSHKN
ncbi:MAG: ASCH domain-containing protein [Anaerolineae bacterium]